MTYSQENPAPIDPLDDLIARREELVGLMDGLTNQGVRSVYDQSLAALDTKIAEVAGPAVEKSAVAAEDAITSLIQLADLKRVMGTTGLLNEGVMQQQEDQEMGTLYAAAELILKFANTEDPRYERILSTAGLVGAVATEAATDDESKGETPSGSMLTPKESAEDAANKRAAVDRIYELFDTAEQNSGTLELMPSSLWQLLALVDRPFMDSRVHNSRLIRKFVDALEPEHGITIVHNQKTGRGARYLVAVDRQQAGQGDKPNEKFDLDQYLPTEDALVLCTLLDMYREDLEELGLDALPEDATALLESITTDENHKTRSSQEVKRARMQTGERLVELFVDLQAVYGALESIDQDDPRYPLFNYLCNQFTKQGAVEIFMQLVQAQKELVIKMDIGNSSIGSNTNSRQADIKKILPVLKRPDGTVLSGEEPQASTARPAYLTVQEDEQT